MVTTLRFTKDNMKPLPFPYSEDDVRLPIEVAEHFIKEYTSSGDTVFDPFAGFGTTVAAAESLGRKGVGMELLPSRVEYMRHFLTSGRVFHGDARLLDGAKLPEFDFCFTSPPVIDMHRKEGYPFHGYRKESENSYEDYLADLRSVFFLMWDHEFISPNGKIAVEIPNVSSKGGFTPLASDAAAELAKIYKLEKEYEIIWEGTRPYGFGQDSSYVYVFRQ